MTSFASPSHPVSLAFTPSSNNHSLLSSPPPNSIASRKPQFYIPGRLRPSIRQHRSPCLAASAAENGPEEEEEEAPVQELKVPVAWLTPSIALQESEWLRAALHRWLDDEYCPEETNVDISKVAARSYLESLMERRSELGEILLKMAKDLESQVSFRESFHGAFSSANAAIHLITLRIDSMAD
ncbi:uncharacterized protein LOC121987854 [Zingiber officinale]|uniref:Uncharacterized protein n=1 Tax=Zingiber officinale TaxID=94328 RepID=A0A8J5GF61_ZINOF|nr:uncharacterized protein LOC121987854 [Zingiber officinale]KAG6505231.1 hypothetical protein ZIOFF_037585 [Zingiber officinale]